MHVASQTKNLPLDQGIKDNPSGRERSEADNPVGSSLEGTLADCKERWIIIIIIMINDIIMGKLE